MWAFRVTIVIGTCELCGEHTRVRPALVAWKSVVLPFGNVDRCVDSDACKARVVERGDEWPLIEKGTTDGSR
jgi:hypothetical protein